MSGKNIFRGVLRNTTRLRRQHTEAKLQQDVADLNERSAPPLRSDYSREACDARLRWVENQTNTKLTHFGQWWNNVDQRSLKGNIEMPIGLVKVPVAAVGPLTIHGEAARGSFIAPFATTEGALTASAQRGVTAINAGSGVVTSTGQQHCSRGPCFVTGNARQALMLGNWVKRQKQQIQEQIVRKTSGHAMLEDIVAIYDMEAVHLVFLYSTGDACGQNVATVCTWNAMNWLVENASRELLDVKVKHAWIEANATSDKKPGALNILLGRGMNTQASVVLPEHVVNKHLGCTGDDYVAWTHYCTRMTNKTNFGGGAHINPANTLAAMFIATGQDPACVADGTAGVTFDVRKNEGEGGGVLASISFPSLLVGTVGGGTGLPTQSEGLAMLDCQGAGKVRKFAEIVTAFALALDISTSSAIVAGKFATGHNKLGRNRPE